MANRSYMKKKSIRDIEINGHSFIVRVDFNVPLDEKGNLMDDTRMTEAMPTIKYLLDNGARKIILCSHLGRPKGERNEKYSLKHIVKRLEELAGVPIVFANDCIGKEANEAVKNAKQGEIVLLENLRFHEAEEQNDRAFAKILASYADIYVNDAFGTAHRKHASTVGITEYLPSVAGLLLEKELSIMGQALEAPQRPFVVVLGGAKVADKIGVIKNLINKADKIIIGGAMSFAFDVAQGFNIGKSLFDDVGLEYARETLELAAKKNVKLLLPVDYVVADEFKNDAKSIKIVDRGEIGPDYMGLDIGPKSAQLFAKEVENAKTVIWNGPMGAFEMENFCKGTLAVAKALAKCTGTTIVGGGDSAAAIDLLGFTDFVTHVSTGGGASLKFLEGKPLVGVEALLDKESFIQYSLFQAKEVKTRKPLICANWKMNKTVSEAQELVGMLLPLVRKANCEIAICPPYTVLYELSKQLKGTNIALGAQNMNEYKSGAYTGEISADMLLELMVKYVIIGHSERRQYYNETDKSVAAKVKYALEKRLKPIICVGESLEERESDKTFEVLERQVRAALEGVSKADSDNICFAYEPIWAIGTGKTATAEQANEAIGFIRSVIAKALNEDAAGDIRILYGGSMNEKNVSELMAKDQIDGGLIGGASLNALQFSKVVNY